MEGIFLRTENMKSFGHFLKFTVNIGLAFVYKIYETISEKWFMFIKNFLV